MDRGEGSLGKLSKDDQLYVNTNEAVMSLNKAAAEMQKLLADVRREPKRYFKVSVYLPEGPGGVLAGWGRRA